MIDVEKLIEIADENIEDLLSALLIDYRVESDYICIKCLFHGGDGWNLRFKDGFWYCFSQCRRKYSTINIVMKVLDTDFLGAVNWLCDELNIENDNLTVDTQKIAVKAKLRRLKALKHKRSEFEYKKVSQDILNDIERFDHPYMLQQGFSHKTLEHFNVGYARNGVLDGRITFPIDNPNGDIISISGRLPTDEDLGIPKYKILGNTDKASTLYNISRIDPNDNYVVVVEGMMAVLDLYQYGIKSVVAVMGSSLSGLQKGLLLGLGRKIICIGDNDESGQRLNQQIYNQCYKFCDVVKIDLGEFTDVEKASPRERDIGFDKMTELVDYLEGVIR